MSATINIVELREHILLRINFTNHKSLIHYHISKNKDYVRQVRLKLLVTNNHYVKNIRLNHT